MTPIDPEEFVSPEELKALRAKAARVDVLEAAITKMMALPDDPSSRRTMKATGRAALADGKRPSPLRSKRQP